MASCLKSDTQVVPQVVPPQELEPDSSMWLPVMPITSGELTLRPAGEAVRQPIVRTMPGSRMLTLSCRVQPTAVTCDECML